VDLENLMNVQQPHLLQASPLAKLFFTSFSSTAYPITVGAGGSPGDNSTIQGNGSNSIFSTITSAGGGGGGDGSPK
jgi:hypothetical protein